MPNSTFILSTTGEYLILPNLVNILKNHVTPTAIFEAVYATSLPIDLEKAWETIQSCIKEHPEGLGDDDYFDYFPDLLNQYLQLAYQKSPEDYQKAYKQIQEDPYIKAEYLTEGPIDNYLDSPEYIQEILTPFINH